MILQEWQTKFLIKSFVKINSTIRTFCVVVDWDNGDKLGTKLINNWRKL